MLASDCKVGGYLDYNLLKHPIPSPQLACGSIFMKDVALTAPAAKAILVPTIFHEPWWLDVVCEGGCRQATVSAGGIVVGRLPYLVKKVAGQTVISMPSMTHVLGPALAAEVAESNFPRSLRQFSVTSDLIAQLPKASHIAFRLHGGVTNTLAFDSAGYSNGVHFTIEIPADTPDRLWRQMRDKTRNVIRRAQERLNVIDVLDPKQFLDFYEQNLEEKGLRNQYRRYICDSIMTECVRREVGRFLVAVDPAGNFEAAIFSIWDCENEYYFMSTRTLGSMNGATSLLIWTAIQHAALKGLTFDMDGVNVRGNRLPNLRLVTGFGGIVKPRYLVWRTSAAIQIAQHFKSLLTSRWF